MKTKMNTYGVRKGFERLAEETVIKLRRDGAVVFTESDDSGHKRYIVTDANRETVILTAGHGQLLDE